MVRKSNIRKMLQTRAEPDKQIVSFPLPYTIQSSPYLQTDFKETTKKACLTKFHSVVSSVKISKVIVLGDVSVGKTCLVNR